jgi:DNA-binding transcriptional LysR family regulator
MTDEDYNSNCSDRSDASSSRATSHSILCSGIAHIPCKSAGLNAKPNESQLIEFSPRKDRSFPKLIGRLRFKHLSLLVALDEHRNLHRAANAAHMAQPNASKLIHDLELILGFPLFDRLPTGMRPTALGIPILDFARHTLHSLRRVGNEVDERKAGRDKHLIIGTTMEVASDVIAQAMSAIKIARPSLCVKFVGDNNEEIIDRVRQGKSELAVGQFGDIPDDDDIVYEAIGREPLCIVARKHHPLCRESRVNISALERACWILPPLSSSISQIVEQAFTQSGMNPPKDVVESHSSSATLTLLFGSEAVALLPESAVSSYVRANMLVKLPIWNISPIEFGILWRGGEPLGAAAADFSRLLKRYAGGLRNNGTTLDETDSRVRIVR